MSKIVFLSFADRSLYLSARRIERQARKMQVYDEIHVFNATHLVPWFREKYHHQLSKKIKGFGYWCWKPPDHPSGIKSNGGMRFTPILRCGLSSESTRS